MSAKQKRRPPSEKLTQSRHTATALQYHADQDKAPRVVATGSGTMAERIVALAEDHDIPLISDPALAQTLAKLELDTEIPPELYLAVAQILAFVYRLDADSREPDLKTPG